MKRTLVRLGLAALVSSALFGCGSGGSDGINGTNGTPGVAGTPGAAGTTAVLNVTNDQWAAMNWNAAITSASIPADGKPVVKFTVKDEQGKPISGLAYASLNKINSTATIPAYANFGFAVAKLVPGACDTCPSKWVSYIVTATPTYKSATDHTTGTNPASPRTPTTDNQGTMVEDAANPGNYTYTFVRSLNDIQGIVNGWTTYSSTQSKAQLEPENLAFDTAAKGMTHRVAMQLQGAKPGTGTNTPDGITVTAAVNSANPVAAYLDFRPDGAAVAATRTITRVEVCQSCHKGTLLHGRKDPNLCVVCHTNQAGFGLANVTFPTADLNPATRDNSSNIDGMSTFTFPRWVHRIHMGEELLRKGYNVGNVLPNEVRFPQDQRNCVKCHDASASAKFPTTNGDNWKNKPGRLACGGCHDGINFATGTGTRLSGETTGHGAGVGPLTDDTKCEGCHKAADTALFHTPVAPVAAATKAAVAGGASVSGQVNGAPIAAYDKVPVGAIKVTWEIDPTSAGVTVNTNRNAVVRFRGLQNGVVTPFKTYTAGSLSIWDNFVGAPSVQLAFAVPQDGNTSPTDINVQTGVWVRNLWSSVAGAGTLTGPDATGYYTATLTGVKIPTTAKLIQAGIGYTYGMPATQPLTQTNVAGYAYDAAKLYGGLIVPAPNVWKVASGSSSRRIIVENERCNTCHEKLGVFAGSAYHAGQRNDAQTCNWCHNPNRASSGWSAGSTTFVHGIHAASKRSVKFNWHAVANADGTQDGFMNIGYPGSLRNCQACHLPDTVNFGAVYTRGANNSITPISSSIINSASSSTQIATFNANFDNRLYTSVATGTYATTAILSPYVTAGTNYGAGSVFTAATGVLTEAAATTLVTSPTSTACFACHDTAKARLHMEDNGGSIYAPRTAALAKKENCLSCHAAGKVADVQVVHQ